MVKQIVVCDKCGKEITGDVKQINGLDLCEECHEELLMVIQNWIDNDEVEEIAEIEEPAPVQNLEKYVYEKLDVEEDKPSNRKRYIDWDKACALKMAGWTNRAISEELKCNFNTINVSLYAHLTEYKERKAKEAAKAKRDVSNPWKE